MARFLIFFLLLGWAGAANAEAISILAAIFGAFGATVAVATVLAYATVIGLTLYASSNARRTARDARASARADVIANLQDRTANLLQNEIPPQVIYGEPGPVGGSVVAVIDSGNSDEYKHVVIVFAAHEVEAIDAIYLGGVEAVPDPDGWVRSAEFYQDNNQFVSETLNFTGDPPRALSSKTPRLLTGQRVSVQTAPGTPETEQRSATPPTLVNYIYRGARVWEALAPGLSLVEYSCTDFVTRLHITKHLGGAYDYADVFLRHAVPEKWTVTHLLSGCAYAVITYDLRHSRFQSPPSITAKIKGKKVYDYRTGLTTYSRNPVLCTADYLRSIYGFEASLAQLNIASIVSGANSADIAVYKAELAIPLPAQKSAQAALDVDPEHPGPSALAETEVATQARLLAALVVLRASISTSVGVSALATQAITDAATPGKNPRKHLQALLRFAQPAGGSTALFVCDGVFNTKQDREAVLNQMEDSFSGYVHRAGGIWKFSVGVWQSPVKTLTQNDFLGAVQITQASYSSKDRYNTARGSYISSFGLGSSEGYPTYMNSSWLSSDGLERASALSFAFTSDPIRCRNLARTKVEKSRGGLTLEIPMHMSAWPLAPGDRVWVRDARYGFSDKTFIITDWVHNTASPLTLQLLEDVESYYDLAEEIFIDPAPNTILPNPYWAPQSPKSFQAESGESTYYRQADGTILSRVRLSWLRSNDPQVLGHGTVCIRYKRSGISALWEVLAPFPGNTEEVFLANLLDGTTYVFGITFKNGIGSASAEEYVTGSVSGRSSAYLPVIGLKAEILVSGVSLSWEPSPVPDYKATHVKNGASWLSAVELGPLGTRLEVSSNSISFGWVSAKELTYAVKHLNTSGNTSATPSFASITVLPPAAVTLTKVEMQYKQLNLQWRDAKTSQPLRGYIFRAAMVVGGIEQAIVDWGGAGADSRSTVLYFDEVGVYNLYVHAVDVAGNAGLVTVTGVEAKALVVDYTDLSAAVTTKLNLLTGTGPGSVNAQVVAATAPLASTIAANALTQNAAVNLLGGQVTGAVATSGSALAQAQAALSAVGTSAYLNTDPDCNSAGDWIGQGFSIVAVADGISGPFALELDATATIRGPAEASTNSISVSPGQVFQLDLLARIPPRRGDPEFQISVAFYDELGGYLTGSDLIFRSPFSEQFEAWSTKFSAPPGAVRAQLTIAVTSAVMQFQAFHWIRLEAATFVMSKVLTEETARITADTALASTVTTLAAQVVVGDQTNTAAIVTEQTARATADTALANTVTTLAAQVVGNKTSSDAALVTEQTARATADTALANTVTTLAAQVTSGDQANTAAIVTEQTARADADGALTTRINTVAASAATNAAAIVTEQTARANADGALTNSVTTLTAAVAGISGGYLNSDPECKTLSAWSGSNYSIATISDGAAGNSALVITGGGNAWSKAVSVSAGQVLRVEAHARKTSGDGYLYIRLECFAAGGALQNNGFTAIEALSIGAGFTRFAGTLTVTPGGVLARVAIYANYGGGGVTQLQAVRLTDDSRASELSASLVQESVVRASVDGGLLAQYTVKTDVAGLISGFGLASTATTAAPSSVFGVRANSFYIAPPALTSAFAPTSGLYNGFVWYDISQATPVTRYYNNGSWSLTPGNLPFIVQASPTYINGQISPAGIYANDLFLQNGSIVNAKIGKLQVDDGHITNLSVNKLVAGSLQVGAYAQSSNYSPGNAGWRINGDGTAEFAAVAIRGKLTTDQIEVGAVTAVQKFSGVLSEPGPHRGAPTGFNSLLTVTTTGAPVFFSATINFRITSMPIADGVASIEFHARLYIDNVPIHESEVWTRNATFLSDGALMSVVTLPMLWQQPLAAGTHTFNLHWYAWTRNSTGYHVTADSMPSTYITSFLMENKV